MQDISVIIPVYNGEKTLISCIQSVYEAGDRVGEIIIVDDGSTDKTLSIALSFSDARIKVIHTDNHGSYTARSTGIKASSLPYLAFIDADDRFIPKSLDLLAELIENNTADIAVGGYLEVDSLDSPVAIRYTDSCFVFTKGEFWPRLMKWKTQEFQWYLWNKLYKRELFDSIIEAIGLCQGDDVLQSAQVFLKAKRVVETKNTVYLYYQNPESTMHGRFGDKDLDLIRVWDFVVELTQDEKEPIVDGKTLHDLALFNRWRTDYTLITRLILANDKELDQKYAMHLQKWREGLKKHWKDLVSPHAISKNREMMIIGLRFIYGPVKALIRLGITIYNVHRRMDK